MEGNYPTLEDLVDAHSRIRPYIHRTPVLTSTLLNSISGSSLYFKCENFQKVGAFKMRGALNSVMQLNKREKSKGVITHSSGNHAQALALAAKYNGVKATVVMPKNAPKVKISAVKDYGAEVEFCEPTLMARKETVDRIIKRTGATFIHPYNDLNIISGQASAAKELIEDMAGLDFIVAPVGGGGLLSGTSLSAKYFSPKTKVIGAEPKGADDAYLSFASGHLIEQDSPKTIADGLLTSLGDKTFPIILHNVEQIQTVSEDEIIRSMKLIFERLKIVVEPSSAVALAAVLKQKEKFRNSKVGIILSGGNVDCNKLPF